MATLEFVAGVITSAVTASNTKADTVFTNAALLLGYEGNIANKQAVADFVMAEIKKQLTNWSRQYQEQVDVSQAIEDVLNNPNIEFED